MVLSQDEKAAFKLARLQALSTSHKEIIKNILEQEGDINYALPVDSSYGISRPYLQGYTALHFACMMDNTDLFVNLLNHGADFTKKNERGQTVLHKLVLNPANVREPLNNPFINAVLLAHVNAKNIYNPCNKDGLSHFHIACMANDSTAAQFFLENGISVNESVSMDSKVLPGYTPLHFAAMCTNTKVVEILLAYGANIHIADARGMTAVHILIERKMQMFDSIATCKNKDSYKNLQDKILENDKIINMLLENISSNNDCLDSIGLSNFHVACMLQDKSIAEHLADRVTDLDHCINMDSRLWPGYTPLHFAGHFNVDTVKMLMKKGANVEAKDSKGLTPLDICMERYKIEDICDIMSLNANWRNILFSDDETKLLSLLHALAYRDQFKKFINRSIMDINMCIPMESPLWSGYTVLHLIVLFADRTKHIFYEDRAVKQLMDLQVIKFCLSKSADLSIQDSRGRTALHLAFRLNKLAVVDAILRHCRQIPNVSDEDDLSHLHIVCATSDKTHKLKKCILDNAAVNAVFKGTSPVNIVKPGSTPLHACLFNREDRGDLKAKIKILLKSGADPNIKDAYGLTPIHWLLSHHSSSKYEASQLLNKVSNDCVAEEYGVSYLHVACQLSHQVAAKRLLNNGADVNLAINYPRRNYGDPLSFLSTYDKCTPLHASVAGFAGMEKLLLDHGANVFTEKADGSTALTYTPVLSHFISTIWNNVDLQRRMRREYGWTKLHLACHSLQVDGFEDLVRAESTDVNARVHLNSPVWKGYTPLQLLMYRGCNYCNAEEQAYLMSRVLVENGADVTVIDDQRNSPIGMLFKYSVKDTTYKQAALLIKYHTDFTVNPVNDHGISHFHIACYVNDVTAIEGFLLHGVDVNHPVDFFTYWRPGCTPLHLASQLQVVELLINHGANIHIEDVDGCDVLSEALARDIFDKNVIAKIIESGADVNGLNFKGQTPFEIAISKGRITIEKLRFCIEQGFLVNSCNPIIGIGYIALILEQYYRDKNLSKLIVETIMNENPTAILGRTTLHHLVTRESSIPPDDYILLLEKLLRSGQDIDQQDNEGKTALHLAVEFRNGQALRELLMCGADMNVLDVNGRSPLTCVSTQSAPLHPESESIKNVLTIHAWRLLSLKLDLCKINADAVSDARKSLRDYAGNRDFYEQIARSKEIELEVRSMRLSDFLTETGAIAMYPSLNQLERCRIDEYFESINNDHSVKGIRGFLKLQYRKAVKRLELFSAATNSLRLLLDFPLPDLCSENIFQYLRNSDLKNIISAEIENEDMRMEVD